MNLVTITRCNTCGSANTPSHNDPMGDRCIRCGCELPTRKTVIKNIIRYAVIAYIAYIASQVSMAITNG